MRESDRPDDQRHPISETRTGGASNRDPYETHARVVDDEFAAAQGVRRRATVAVVIGDDFAFFGFDETSWSRLVSLVLGEGPNASRRGVLVVVVDAGGLPVALFHTADGSLDPATLPEGGDLESVCAEMDASACIVVRERAMTDIESYLAEPLDPSQDFASRVVRFAHVLRELGSGNWLRVWPNPVPELLLPAAPAARPVLDLVLPEGSTVVLGVFEGSGLWTGVAVRRGEGGLDAIVGPEAMREWAGPLGGAWRRDHRVLARAVGRELGPLHAGLFMERPTARRLFEGRGAGDWAMAFATRDVILHPLPASAAAGLGLDVISGVAQSAVQILQDMDPDDVAHVAKGFWRGLTDGRGLEGLLELAPTQALVEAVGAAVGSRPPAPSDDADTPIAPAVNDAADDSAS